MVLQEGGDRLLWMDSQESIATKFSQYDEPLLQDNKNDELFGNIKRTGMDIYVVNGKRV